MTSFDPIQSFIILFISLFINFEVEKSSVVYRQAMLLVTLKAQVAAYHAVFLVFALVVMVGAVTALWIKVENEKLDVEVRRG